MASFEAEIESAKSTLFYAENGYKKQVIVKNDTILKSGKNGHLANVT